MRFAALLLSLAVAGCATGPTPPEVFPAAAQTWRAKGADRLATISGQVLRSGRVHRLVVAVDGVTVLDGDIGTGNADITGQFNGKPTQGLCNRKENSRQVVNGVARVNYSVVCRVVIDGEFIATLTFT